MLVDRGPGLGSLRGLRSLQGLRGLGQSITVVGTPDMVETVPVEIQTPDVLTYSGGDSSSSLDLSNYFNWLTGATPAPAGPVFFPSQSSGSNAGTVNAITSLASQVASLFRPTAGASAGAAAQQAGAAAQQAGGGAWLKQNMGLVVGGGIGLVAVLVLLKKR